MGIYDLRIWRSCGGVLEGGDDGGEGVGGGYDAGEQQEAAGVSGGLLGLSLCTVGVLCRSMGGEGELVALVYLQLRCLSWGFCFHLRFTRYNLRI